MSTGLALILDDNRGCHIPQHFVEDFDYSDFGVSEDQAEILRKGHIIENDDGSWDYNECYWEVWNEVQENAEFTDTAGDKWKLYQDGAVWLYCEKLMSEQEKADFFPEYEKEKKRFQIQVTYYIDVETDVDADAEDEAIFILDNIERGTHWSGDHSDVIYTKEYDYKIVSKY